MTETVETTLPLGRWSGDRGTYHMVILSGEQAEQITTHAALHRMEFGKQRGFGSVKVMAQIGATEWKSSVFPSTPTNPGGDNVKDWWLLVGKKVMRAEDLAEGDPVELCLELL